MRIHRKGLKSHVGRTVIAHVGSEHSIQGVLVGVHHDCFALAHPRYLQEVQPAQLGGEVVIPWERVSFLQLVAASDDA